MEYRNSAYNSDGGIDMEINHPAFGWIPFTATAGDSEQLGRDLYDLAAGTAAAYVPPPPPTADELREAMPTITQRQLRLTLGKAMVEDIDAALAGDWDATTEWTTASVFRRTHPLIIQLGAQFGFTPEHVDDLWTFAQTIK
ncbi:hypothetical protein [Mesorhizobium sp. M7A.F.Ca.MR.362.00.0.0]|uniref:hypothetical protein n=1 Tax=Mesorhizobium sp. M7A.F.Ca.MR.362.00.0.0 TaxID=2496779 RepID=UPI000FD34E75|nr:hypothetical protein [Mesorhizobium sp. M7A.F.Ca.MR.362.00.0.0]RUU79037.1 hypothetical protein EOC06_17705 [Mesorhizobium sp. M7A.F.Ca.MR.362.00.0.0]RWN95123.1 MAG: hypothetical protein EOS05_10000 [Mesorhizobium sp.]